MARAKTKQTVIEKQHVQLLKKKGIKIADWEEKTFKKAIGEFVSRKGEFYEYVLDFFRKEDNHKAFEEYLEDESQSKGKEDIGELRNKSKN